MQNNQENPENKTKFNVTVDGVGYRVSTEPFMFNNQVRYNVQVNEENPAVFAWDTKMLMFRSLSDSTSVFPDGLLQAINEELIKTP